VDQFSTVVEFSLIYNPPSVSMASKRGSDDDLEGLIYVLFGDAACYFLSLFQSLFLMQ
jgi:hypothetical protein